MKRVFFHSYFNIIAFSIVFLILLNNNILGYAEILSTENNIDYKFADASVLDVSSGPMHEVAAGKYIHYRIITVLVEVSIVIYYQQIQYGDENCCLKINFTKEISGKDLEGQLELFKVEDISWLANDTFQFLGNSARYTIKLSEERYLVEKHNSRPKGDLK